MRIDVYFHLGDGDPDLAAIKTLLHTLTRKVDTMSASVGDAIEAIRAKVDRLDTVEDAVLAFIGSVPQLIADAVAQAQAAGATPEQLAALDELAARLGTETESLASAVTNNTPAA